MTYRNLCCAACFLVLSGNSLWADVSYQETTQITGGAMLGVMKMAGAFARGGHKPTDPIQSSVAIKENRMVRKSADTATIIDLDKQTMLTIDYQKKSYSVMTFEQMRQMLERQTAKAKSEDGQKVNASVDVKLEETGQKRTIAGTETHEVVMTVTMSGTDSQSGQTGAMNVVSDMWLGSDFQGSDEIRNFNQRLGQELGSIPFGGANRPEISKAMAEMYKQGSKLGGVPLETVMKLGAAGQPANGSSSGSASATRPAANADNHSDQQASQPTSLSGVMAGALGQHFGFGHKKKPDSASNEGNGSGAAPNSTSDALIEMTSHTSNFSTGSVDTALFEVPAGFSQRSN